LTGNQDNDKNRLVLIIVRHKVKKRNKSVEVELTKSNDKLVIERAKKCGLNPEIVMALILECEINILWHIVNKRKKLCKLLKIRPTTKRLLCSGLIGPLIKA